eukprot:2372518-Rhodomonas_salina.1
MTFMRAGMDERRHTTAIFKPARRPLPRSATSTVHAARVGRRRGGTWVALDDAEGAESADGAQGLERLEARGVSERAASTHTNAQRRTSHRGCVGRLRR